MEASSSAGHEALVERVVDGSLACNHDYGHPLYASCFQALGDLPENSVARPDDVSFSRSPTAAQDIWLPRNWARGVFFLRAPNATLVCARGQC